MALSAHAPGSGPGLSFDGFVAAFGQLVWTVLGQERARTFHGGRPCPQRTAPRRGLLSGSDGADTCPEDCASIFLHTTLLLWEELRRALAKGDPSAADPVRFARRRAGSRFLDAVRTVNQVERGHLTRPRRTVEKSAWIDRALGGNRYHQRLLVDVLHYLQSDDPPEPGSDLPYRRLAAAHGTDAHTVHRDVWKVIRRIERARPDWADRQVYRLLGSRLARQSVPPDLLEQVEDAPPAAS